MGRIEESPVPHRHPPLPEVLRREGMAGAEFQVLLERLGLRVVLEADHDDRLPGTVLRGSRGFAGVMLLEAFLKVGADAGVSFLRIGEALEEVDVLHRNGPCRWSVLLRSP